MAVVSVPLADLPAWLEARAKALAAADLTKPLKVIRLLLISSTKSNFAGSHDPDGGAWAPLKWRKGQPLRDTGMLMASLTAGGVGSIDELTSKGLTYGSSLVYAAVQNYGATISLPERRRDRPWVFKGRDGRTVFTRRLAARTFTVPARRFLGVTDALRARINDVLRKYVAGIVGGK